jgi:hypothetical protein
MGVRHRDGRVRSTFRNINTRLNAELLVGDGWEGVAHAELLRLSLEVGAYHSQLKSREGYEETVQAAGRAVEALEAACAALNKDYASENNGEGGLELQLQPDR